MSIITQKYGALEILTAENIAAPHCFTTRFGGVSTGALESMNLAIKLHETDGNVARNFEILGEALGFGIDDLVLTRQTHSDIVRVVGRCDCNGCFHRDYPECDALVTNDPGVALVVFTADCTPILLHDPLTGAVGAAHAGWRGTAAGIAAKTVEAMVREFGCKPEDIRAAIGPCIGPCCFETDRDVPVAMEKALGAEALPWIRPQGEKYYVNLKELNAVWLRRVGVSQIDIATECTACRPDRFWSHRKVGDSRGSLAAMILLRGDSQ